MQQRKRRRLAGAGRTNQRDGLSRQGGEIQIDHRGPLAVVGERDVPELDQAVQPTGIGRIRPVVQNRGRVEHLEEVGKARRVDEHAVDEPDRELEPLDDHRGDRHEGDDLADRGEALQMQPGSQDDDGEDRDRGRGAGEHGQRRPPGEDRHLGAEQLVDHVLERRDLRLDAGEALHQGDVAERIGGAFSHLGIVLLDRPLHAFGPSEHQRHQHREHEAEHDEERREPPIEEQRERQQDDEGDETDEMIAEERKPQGPQRVGAGKHHLQ